MNSERPLWIVFLTMLAAAVAAFIAIGQVLDAEEGSLAPLDATPGPQRTSPPQVADPGAFEVPRPTTTARVSRGRVRVTAPTTIYRKSPPAPSTAYGSVWDALANCESGGRWHLNTGNGYYGGLQFSLRSWQWVGGTGYPHQHSREVQIAMGQRLQQRQGWSAWPTCSRKLGLR